MEPKGNDVSHVTLSVDRTMTTKQAFEEQKNASDTAPLRRDDLVLEELDGEALLYDSRNGAIHRFNATTFFVWNACDGSCTPNDIAVSLLRNYSVDADEAQRAVLTVIEQLHEEDLLDKERSGSGNVVDRLKLVPRLRSAGSHST